MTKSVVDKTDIFEKWFNKLKDRRAKNLIIIHIGRMIDGNPGNSRNVGDGIWEKKINYGPGYPFTIFKRPKLGFYCFAVVTNLRSKQT